MPVYLSFPLVIFRLALGAEVAATVADRDTFNGCAADRTGFATTVGNPKVKVGGTGFTAGAKVASHAGPFIADS